MTRAELYALADTIERIQAEGEQTDRLARGEAVPGGPGACSSCHHAKVWHNRANRVHECERCNCGRFAR